MILSEQVRERLRAEGTASSALVLLCCSIQDRLAAQFPDQGLVVGSLRSQRTASITSDDSLCIQMGFNGSGDSGDVDRPYTENKVACEFVSKDPEICRLMSDYIHAYADWDWYNNDGGGGTLFVYPNHPLSSSMEGYYNVSEAISADGVDAQSVNITEDE